MEASATGRVPMSYWMVTVPGLLWNSFGAYLYTWSKLQPEAALAGASPEMREYVTHMPLWAHLGWSLGIWGSFIGSVLMVLRSRHATGGFLVSLIGAVLSFIGQGRAGVLGPVEPSMILGVIMILWWYCHRATERGLLR